MCTKLKILPVDDENIHLDKVHRITSRHLQSYGRSPHICMDKVLNGALYRAKETFPFYGHLQYCVKVMQAKCTNFVLCSRDFSTKVRLKVRMNSHGIWSNNSLEQRAIFL